VPAQHVAGGDQGEERDRADDDVADRAGGHPVDTRIADGEPAAALQDERAGQEEPDPVGEHQPRCPGAAGGAAQRPSQAGRTDDREHAADQEVRDLEPAEIAVGQHAQREADQVEALAGGDLGERDGAEDRDAGDEAAEQRAGAGVVGGAGGRDGHDRFLPRV
jgi:hypothetical protein